MAAFVFNVAKGRIAELFLSSAGGQIVLLEAAEADDVLRKYDTLNELLAASGNVELQHPSYARKTGIGGTVIVSDLTDEAEVSIPSQTFAALEGNPVKKALVCFDRNGVVIPLTCHDWPLVPDGSDATLRFP